MRAKSETMVRSLGLCAVIFQRGKVKSARGSSVREAATFCDQQRPDSRESTGRDKEREDKVGQHKLLQQSNEIRSDRGRELEERRGGKFSKRKIKISNGSKDQRIKGSKDQRSKRCVERA